jgi:phage terminase small subunit
VPTLNNSRHERFAQEVAKGQSATAAYRAAGYEATGASVGINAGRLLKNAKVRARVDEILAEGAERAGVTVERVVRELAKIGFSDIRKAMKWGETVMVPCAPEVADHFIRSDGKGIEEDFEAEVEEELEPQPRGGALKRRRVGADGVIAVRAHTPMALVASDQIDEDTAAAIAEVKQTREGLAFKLHDKLGALEKLGKHLGMFRDKVEHSGPGGGPIQTESRPDLTGMSPDERDALRAILERRAEGPNRGPSRA